MTFAKGKSGNPKGRVKGSINKAARLKAQLVDAVEFASKQAGYKSVAKYLGSICAADPIAFIRIAASMLPKELALAADETLAAAFASIAKKEK